MVTAALVKCGAGGDRTHDLTDYESAALTAELLPLVGAEATAGVVRLPFILYHSALGAP